jgi:hypothetical protein
MSATVDIAETNGTSAASVETIEISNLNFGSNDSAELTPASYPITSQADGHAYEKWVRFRVSNMGGSAQLDNLKVWISNLGGGYKTEEGVSTNLRVSGYSAETYPTGGPVDTDSAVADQVTPLSEPAGPNIGIGGSLAGTIVAATSYSDFIVIQLDVTENTPAGSLNTKTFTFQWDEQ